MSVTGGQAVCLSTDADIDLMVETKFFFLNASL